MRLHIVRPSRRALVAVLVAGLALYAVGATPVLAQPIEQAKLTASDGAVLDRLGRSVSMDGDTVVIGADGDDDARGSAYVFVRTGTTWMEQAKLTASDAAEGDGFGLGVSVDGDTVVVSAPGADFLIGAAYVFVRSGTTWSEQAKLTASDAAGADRFGGSVSVNGDTVVVGAADNDDAGISSGSAYVFVRSGTTWSEQAKLTASDAAGRDGFGGSVSLDGDTVVVGATGDDDAGSASGSAYVFVRSGTTWSEQAKLTASDAATFGQFGGSVSMDGDTVVIGADGDDGSRGSAYVFVRSGATWSEQAKLTASDAAGADRFGISVSVNGDTVVVGAISNDDAGSGSGSAYVFVRSGTTWSEQAKLTASDAAAFDFFGISVSVDGDTVVVGAYQADDAGFDSGAAYVFSPPPAQCISDLSTAPGLDALVGRQLSILADQVNAQLSYAEQLPPAQAAYVHGAIRRLLANWTNVLIPLFERQGRIPAAVAPQLTGCVQGVAAAIP